MSASTEPLWKSLPSTAARSITARSSPVRRSRRAASSAWMVGGTGTVVRSPARRPATILAHEQAVVDEHREHLLDEERIPLGRVGDAGSDLLGELGLADEVRDELRAFVFRQRLEEHGRRVELSAAPRWADIEELGSSHAEKQDGHSLATSRRGARRDRGTSPRPNGCRRTPRRAAAGRRGPRRIVGSPGSSPRRRCRTRTGRAPRSSAATMRSASSSPASSSASRSRLRAGDSVSSIPATSMTASRTGQ